MSINIDNGILLENCIKDEIKGVYIVIIICCAIKQNLSRINCKHLWKFDILNLIDLFKRYKDSLNE